MPFYEHIFLESSLDEFPQLEPVIEFMTLVLNGISLNSFLTVPEKKEIIKRYKDYFVENQEVIESALAIERAEADYKASLSSKVQSKKNSNVN